MFYKTVVRVFSGFGGFCLLGSLFFSFGFFFAFVVSWQHAIFFFPEYVLYSTTSHIHIYIYTVCILYRYTSHLCTVQKDKPETNDLLVQSK